MIRSPKRRENGLEAAYLRPIAFRGDCGLGVLPRDLSVVETAIIVNEWGTYLGEGALERGVEVCVSSWQRVAPNTIPAGAKAGGNYLSSFLIVSEARERGVSEGIALGTDGLVSEGSGENIFVVTDGRILTPPVSASILSGITRHSAIVLAKDLGFDLVEQSISREQLYAADEIFMTGTAAEVAGELSDVYGLPVVRIPTHRPSQRRHEGERVLACADEKWGFSSRPAFANESSVSSTVGSTTSLQ